MASRRKKQNAENGKKIIIIAVASAAVLLSIFLGAGAMMPSNVIADNVFAGDIDLSGMTQKEAAAILAGENFYEGKTINLVSGEHSTSFSAEEISLVSDPLKTAEKAFKIGKSNNLFLNAIDFFKLFFTEQDIGYVPSADIEMLDSLLYQFGATFNGEFTDYGIEILENKVVISPKIDGQDTDTELARGQVLTSIEKGIYQDIEVTLNSSDSSPLTVDELYERLYTEPMDAEYVYEENEILVKEEVIGINLNKSDLEESVNLLNSNQTAVVNVKTVMPSVTAEILNSKLFNTTLASYSTTYSTSAVNRAANVALAASKINGKILKPGEEFSYNETIGDTTLENGYKVAPIFENGKTSEGVGGGICQVSSTLYSAVLYADLKVVERRNHSLTVAYVPKGQDATVSYGIIDFKFKNNTDYPVKISAATGGGTVTVSIIGTKRDIDRTVQIKHATISTTQPTVNETNDPSLPLGTKKVTAAGKTGYVVDTTKTVLENDKVISSEKITTSTYRMVPTEVSVGTKEEAPVYVVTSPAPTEAPTQAPAETGRPTPKPAEEPAKTLVPETE